MSLLTTAAALAGMLAADGQPWHADYAKALEASAETDRPVLVHFVDSASTPDWADAFDGMDRLMEEFVLVRADVATKPGRETARLFEMDLARGTVVVERSHQWQYFRTKRELSRDQLTEVLEECADAIGRPDGPILANVSATEVEEAESRPVRVGTSSYDSYVSPWSTGSSYCPSCQRR